MQLLSPFSPLIGLHNKRVINPDSRLGRFTRQQSFKIIRLLNGPDHQADDKAIIQRIQPLIGIGCFIRRSHQGFQWGLLDLFAIAKGVLIDKCQQGIEDRRARFPYLVQKREIGLGQIMLGFTNIPILFECLDRDGAKDLLGGTEPVHQILEVGRIGKGTGDATGDQAFGRAGWAVKKGILTTQGTQQCHRDHLLPLKHPFTYRVDQPFHPLL